MKLFIDDIRQAPDETWQVVRTITEALRLIYFYGSDIREISLDHDISHFENLDETDVDQQTYACKETFSAVVYYLVARYSDRPQAQVPKIVFHTANKPAALRMKAILNGAAIKCSIE